MNSEHHLFYRGLELHSSHSLRDQFRGLWTNDVYTQDFAVLFF